MQVLPVSSSKGLSGLSFQTRTIGNKIPNEEYAGAVLSAINDSDWLTVVGGGDDAAPREVYVANSIASKVEEDPPVLIQHTSGSTGKPRAFAFTRHALWKHARTTAEVMEVDRSTPTALAIRRNTAYATSVLLMASESSIPVQLFDPTEIGQFFDAAREGAIGTIDGGVRFWQTVMAFLSSDEKLIDALSTIRVRGVGGDLLPKNCEQYFRERGIPLSNGYGLTQAGPNVAINMRGDSLTPGSCGPPLPGVEIVLQKDELYVRSPFRASAELIDGVLVPIREVDGEGWLQTGDITNITEQGDLVPIGRAEKTMQRRSPWLKQRS